MNAIVAKQYNVVKKASKLDCFLIKFELQGI